MGWGLWLLEAGERGNQGERERQSEKEIAITLDKINLKDVLLRR